MAIFWAESGVAIVVILLRMSGRIMIRKVGLDDYMMLFTLVGIPSHAWRTYWSRYHNDNLSFFSSFSPRSLHTSPALEAVVIYSI